MLLVKNNMRNLPTFVPPLDYARRFTGTDDVLGHYKLGGTRHCDGLALTIFIQGETIELSLVTVLVVLRVPKSRFVRKPET